VTDPKTRFRGISGKIKGHTDDVAISAFHGSFIEFILMNMTRMGYRLYHTFNPSDGPLLEVPPESPLWIRMVSGAPRDPLNPLYA